MATKTISIRVDDNLKKDANKILNELGLTQSQAVNMFFKQVVLHKGIPFDIKLTNQIVDSEVSAASSKKEELVIPKINDIGIKY